jgi:hypothetical protein
LDVQVIRKATPLVTMSTENPPTLAYTLTSTYEKRFSLEFSQKTFHLMPRTRCVHEISSLKHDVQLNSYPQGFFDMVVNSKGSSCQNKEKPLGSVHPIREGCLREVQTYREPI